MMPRAIVFDTYGQTRPLFCFGSMRSDHFCPAACWWIRTGTEFGTLAAVPLWFVLWRGSALSPVTTGLVSGLFLGLIGMTVLEIHCPIRDAWQIRRGCRKTRCKAASPVTSGRGVTKTLWVVWNSHEQRKTYCGLSDAD